MLELVVAIAALVISAGGHVGVFCFGWGRLKTLVCELKEDFQEIKDNHSAHIEKLTEAQAELTTEVAVLTERVSNVLGLPKCRKETADVPHTA